MHNDTHKLGGGDPPRGGSAPLRSAEAHELRPILSCFVDRPLQLGSRRLLLAFHERPDISSEGCGQDWLRLVLLLVTARSIIQAHNVAMHVKDLAR